MRLSLIAVGFALTIIATACGEATIDDEYLQLPAYKAFKKSYQAEWAKSASLQQRIKEQLKTESRGDAVRSSVVVSDSVLSAIRKKSGTPFTVEGQQFRYFNLGRYASKQNRIQLLMVCAPTTYADCQLYITDGDSSQNAVLPVARYTKTVARTVIPAITFSGDAIIIGETHDVTYPIKQQFEQHDTLRLHQLKTGQPIHHPVKN